MEWFGVGGRNSITLSTLSCSRHTPSQREPQLLLSYSQLRQHVHEDARSQRIWSVKLLGFWASPPHPVGCDCYPCCGWERLRAPVLHWLPQSSGPQPFWHRGPVSWKTIFPRTGGGGEWGGRGNGFRMIQVHYIYCALYFYYNYIVIYNEIIIQLTITLTGGGAQAVMRAMGSGCKYR